MAWILSLRRRATEHSLNQFHLLQVWNKWEVFHLPCQHDVPDQPADDDSDVPHHQGRRSSLAFTSEHGWHDYLLQQRHERSDPPPIGPEEAGRPGLWLSFHPLGCFTTELLHIHEPKGTAQSLRSCPPEKALQRTQARLEDE